MQVTGYRAQVLFLVIAMILLGRKQAQGRVQLNILKIFLCIVNKYIQNKNLRIKEGYHSSGRD